MQIAGERFVNLYHRHKVLVGEQQFVLVVQHAGQVDSPTKNKTKNKKKKFINGRKTVSKMAPLFVPFEIFLKFGRRRKELLDGGLLLDGTLGRRGRVQCNLGGILGSGQPDRVEQVVQVALLAGEAVLARFHVTPTYPRKSGKKDLSNKFLFPPGDYSRY